MTLYAMRADLQNSTAIKTRMGFQGTARFSCPFASHRFHRHPLKPIDPCARWPRLADLMATGSVEVLGAEERSTFSSPLFSFPVTIDRLGTLS
jgi:hypothetical protein